MRVFAYVNKWYGDNEDKNWNNTYKYNDLITFKGNFARERKQEMKQESKQQQ